MYAFWLFSYEIFNGILSSYRTNNRNISVQLARRFLDSKEYSPHKWPSDMVSEFLPLLEQFQYNQGSLVQTTLETSMRLKEQCITPLNPVHECVWKDQELDQLKNVIRLVHNLGNDSQVEVLMVTKRSKAILCNNFMLPSSSRHCRSNLAFITAGSLDSSGNDVTLVEVHYYSECLFRLNATPESETQNHSLWVMAAERFMQHPCRVWFGSPSQVWSFDKHSLHFFAISSFVSRVVHIKATVDFGRVHGCLPVIIATPIECNTS